MATPELTQAERDTLNAAEQIIIDRFSVDGEAMLFSFHAGWAEISTTYFTPNKIQHSRLWPSDDQTFAGKLALCLELRAEEDGRADQIKAERIAKLRGELEALTGQAA